jgi:hypothetical protein
MINFPAPAFVHHPSSHLNMVQNDLTYCNKLLEASKETDPV